MFSNTKKDAVKIDIGLDDDDSNDFDTFGSSSLTGSSIKKKKQDNFFEKLSKSSPNEHKKLKALVCFPFGCVVAGMFYLVILRPIDLEEGTKKVVGVGVGFAIAVGYGMSTQVRCIVTLVLPIFFGKSGRSYIAAFAVVYLIGGPVANMIANATEMVRSLSCITQLLANHTAVKYELRYKPMDGSLKELQRKGFVTKDIQGKLNHAFIPIEKELTDQAEIAKLKRDNDKADKASNAEVRRNELLEKRYRENPGKTKDVKVERKWEKKLDYRCEDVFSQGVLRCRKWFANSYDKCMDTLSIVGYLLCWPMKLDFFCQLVDLIPGAIGLNCDSMKVVSPGLGETYVSSRDMINNLKDKMEVSLQYKLVQTAVDLNYMSAEEVRKRTLYVFERKKRLISFILLLVQRFLAFAFVLVFISAYKYHSHYLKDIRFDNNYINAYFKRIDARRKAEGKKTLLPLRKMEKKEVIFPLSLKLQKTETVKFIKGTVTLLFRVLVSGVIFMIDHLLYTVLIIIGRNSQIDYKQTGSHHIDLKVYGKGFMGEIVRLFLSSFNQKHDISHITSNVVCLPIPVKSSKLSMYIVFGIYILVWILLYLQAYGLRLRRLIAAFYYRKREKRRTLFLYNEMMKKRKGFLKHMRHRVKKQVKAQKLKRKTSVLLALRREFPLMCSWLKIFRKDKCLICEDKEKKGFYKCPAKDCQFGYCSECWDDIQHTCYACLNKSSMESTSSSSSVLTDTGSDLF